jgi:precorrin-6A/cobalt-precorrin-6A reductase
MHPVRVLILGGSTEASRLASLLAGDPSVTPILSLAGRTLVPRPQPIACRIGGFGGAEGLAAFLRAGRMDLLVDATHPFAARISANAVAAAAALGVKLLRIERPPWTPRFGDRWQEVAHMADAVAALGPAPRRVFLTVGQQELAPFRAAPWHSYLIRSIDPPAWRSLPPDAHVILAARPFTQDAERALLEAHRTQVIVTKNSGGGATIAKLAAARALGLPVVMVARPVLPPTGTVPDETAARAWIAAHQSARRGA